MNALRSARLADIKACARERRRTIYAYEDSCGIDGISSTIHAQMVPHHARFWIVTPTMISGPYQAHSGAEGLPTPADHATVVA